jgi:hypothetical protein
VSRHAQEDEHVELPDNVLKPHYTIVAVHPEMCREDTSKIHRRLIALKAFEGRTIEQALDALRGSATTPFGMFDMRCHVARRRVIVRGVEVFNEPNEVNPRIVDRNVNATYNWRGEKTGPA